MINIGSKQYPLEMTMGAMLRFKRMTGLEVKDLNTGDMESVMKFIYCCTASACNAQDIEFNLTYDKFEDILEPSEFARAVDALFNDKGEKAQKKSK